MKFKGGPALVRCGSFNLRLIIDFFWTAFLNLQALLDFLYASSFVVKPYIWGKLYLDTFTCQHLIAIRRPYEIDCQFKLLGKKSDFPYSL